MARRKRLQALQIDARNPKLFELGKSNLILILILILGCVSRGLMQLIHSLEDKMKYYAIPILKPKLINLSSDKANELIQTITREVVLASQFPMIACPSRPGV
jgi:hypothetical protein